MTVTVRFESSRSTKNNIVYEAAADENPAGVFGTFYVPKSLAGKKPRTFYDFEMEIAEEGDA